jgi:hypothetical protein
MKGYAKLPMRSFDDWQKDALPTAHRKLHSPEDARLFLCIVLLGRVKINFAAFAAAGQACLGLVCTTANSA